MHPEPNENTTSKTLTDHLNLKSATLYRECIEQLIQSTDYLLSITDKPAWISLTGSCLPTFSKEP